MATKNLVFSMVCGFSGHFPTFFTNYFRKLIKIYKDYEKSWPFDHELKFDVSRRKEMQVVGWAIGLGFLAAYFITHDNAILIAAAIFAVAGSISRVAAAIEDHLEDRQK